MKDWKKIIIKPSLSILEAVEFIEKGVLKFVLVADDDYKLKGSLTDGDVRRGLLQGISLQDSVQQIMNKNPIAFRHDELKSSIMSAMKRKMINFAPLIDRNNTIVGALIVDEKVVIKRRANPVIIMAGGYGSRLGELTKTCPKPLLRIGKKPILQTIIEGLRDSGFYKINLAVNYLSEMIENYFGDGQKFDVEISYLREKEPLGTAGALSLLNQEKIDKPLLVMNGDILTTINYNGLMDFHANNHAYATMAVREFEYKVPFGVVSSTDKHSIIKIEEKPAHRTIINAGIYVIDPNSLNFLPKEQKFNMPDLFQKILEQNHNTFSYLITDYWMDVGQIEDFKQASDDYGKKF